MKENIKIEKSETNRGKKQIIINRKYKFNFSIEKKDNSKVYRCTKYRISNKCKSFIILNDKMEILEYETSKSVVKHKIKETIRKRTFSLDIRPKQESKYYKTENDDDFMIFKNTNLIIFQSPLQAKQFTQYNEDIFAKGTFYISPKFSYQVFITRKYVEKINSFYTTSISILKDKKQSTYETLFKEIKKKCKTDEIKALIECYKNKEEKLICIGCDDDDRVELWYD
ncbi:hypothetical protein U3516DRAFT_758849 [Neocallimastix sp. 'constans']